MSKQNKGITLIALIITIIVMMILVAVSVTVALNGGLFGTAKKAGIETQAKAEEEKLNLQAEKAPIAEVDFYKLDKNLPTGFEKIAEKTYKSSNGNIFQVLKTGEIVQGWIDNGDGTYTNGDKTIKLGETTAINTWLKQEVQKLGGTYQGDWQVIGLEGTKLKLVTTENVGEDVALGYEDSRAKEAIPAVDESAPTGTERFNRSIWSYKNSVDTLNKAAQDATGIKNARSIKLEDIYGVIGEENINKGEDYGKVYKYYYNEGYVYSKLKTGVDQDGNETWGPEIKTNPSVAIFLNQKGEIVKIDTEDEEVEIVHNYFVYTFLDDQKTALGSLLGEKYFFASPNVFCNYYVACYDMPFMNEDEIKGFNIWNADEWPGYENICGIRAVVTI